MNGDERVKPNLPPIADGPQPYDAFWNKTLDLKPEGPLREVTRTMLKNLPAKWLQEVADAGMEVDRQVTEDDIERCKNNALSVLWNNYDWCLRGSQGHCNVGSSHAVSVFQQCIAGVLME